ncbi:DNA-3-methyladenine glycosylase family protein [Nocardioides campestrisoli]|uniref:DNA-3-methyladenine glycosylase family protein n=1 Tax=Nocardioides campestrisoli TaxID=2736757 RepID=UPI00163D72E9|nr:DNA-3-methyladenine glycosylase 2 family protein [Nocardioides campestrisoli]
MSGPLERRWRPSWPCPVREVLTQHRRGGGDPTLRTLGEVVWRGSRTPEGTVTLRVEPCPGVGEVHVQAWGAGAEWALDRLPALLGADDDLSGFVAAHPLVAEGRRRHPHWRLSRTGLVMESVVPSVIEQKVTGQEAFAGFRRLVRRFGEPAPGPGVERDLWVQPSAERIRTIASWEWLHLHIDPARSRALVRAAAVADSLERLGARGAEELDRGLRSLPGIGVWTSAEVRARALGDPDAVSFGDYHVAKDVGWAVTGAPFTDEQMAEFLEPWRPHRGRVVAYLGMTAGHRPRRGPRMAPRTHLPARPVTRRS